MQRCASGRACPGALSALTRTVGEPKRQSDRLHRIAIRSSSRSPEVCWIGGAQTFRLVSCRGTTMQTTSAARGSAPSTIASSRSQSARARAGAAGRPSLRSGPFSTRVPRSGSVQREGRTALSATLQEGIAKFYDESTPRACTTSLVRLRLFAHRAHSHARRGSADPTFFLDCARAIRSAVHGVHLQ